MSFTSKIQYTAQVNETTTDGQLTETSSSSLKDSTSLTVTGVAHDKVTGQTTTATDYDLKVLPSPQANAQDFATISMITIKNLGDTNGLEVDGNFLGLSTDVILVPPECALVLDYNGTPEAVTVTTKDTLSIASAAATTDYEIVISGTVV